MRMSAEIRFFLCMAVKEYECVPGWFWGSSKWKDAICCSESFKNAHLGEVAIISYK